MARVKKDDKPFNADGELKAMLNDLDAVSMASGKYIEITSYIDTGDLMLNAIISGKIFGGIPSGRVTVWAGDSSSGKSYTCGRTVANALRSGYKRAFIFDSEGGTTKSMYVSEGVDPESISVILVSTVEDAKSKILTLLNRINEWRTKGCEDKFLVVLDSIRALGTNKAMKNVEEGNVVVDMGIKQKLTNDMINAMLVPTIKADVPVIVVAGVYDNPAAMFTEKIKQQGGGKGIKYGGHVNIQCASSLERNEDNKKDTTEQAYSRTILKFMTVKNRLVTPYRECQMLLDFRKGPNKYFGLVDYCLKWGIIKCPKQGWYSIGNSDVNVRLSELIMRDDLWQPVLAEIDARCYEEFKYSSTIEELSEVDKMIEVEAIDSFIEDNVETESEG
jgi:RecA/RadA recombinase